MGACGSVNEHVTLVLFPPVHGVELYAHVGGRGGGDAGGADGGWQRPSQSTMYSTYTRLPSYAFSFTAAVAVVANAYEPSPLTGSGA